jgi:hypothetical protein
MLILTVLAVLAATAILQWSSAVGAQSMFGNGAGPSYGATGGMALPSRAPHFSISPDTPAHTHLGSTGEPCLTVQGQAEQQKINPNIYNHTIVGINNCGQAIAVKVCYYQTEDCTRMTIPAYGEKRALLGIMPAMKDFRFQYTEQFDKQFRPF